MDPDRTGSHGADEAVAVHVCHAVVLRAPEDLSVLRGVADAETVTLSHAKEADIGAVQRRGTFCGRCVKPAADPAGELCAGDLGIDPGRAGANGGYAAGPVDGGDGLVLRAPEDVIIARRSRHGQHEAFPRTEKADVCGVQGGNPVGGKGLGGCPDLGCGRHS